jgi:E3 ubiquitin-protein ligase RNF38/44
MASRSNDVPSSSHALEFPGHRVGNQGTSHVSFVPYRIGRSSGDVPYDVQPKPAPSYSHASEELFAPMSSHVDSRRVAMKRKNPVDGINAGDYYVGSSSNSRFSNIVQPNPTALSQPLLPQMPLSIGPSNWTDQRLVNQEGSQRNVRARTNIPMEPRPDSTSTSSNNHLSLFHSAASAFRSTSAERNQASFSLSARTLPSG